MPTTNNYLVLLQLLAAVGSAVPATSIEQQQQQQEKRGGHIVERIPNPNFVGHNGPKAMLKTLRKYAMPVDEIVTRAAERQDEFLVARRRKRRSLDLGSMWGWDEPDDDDDDDETEAATSGLVSADPTPMDVEFLSPISIGGQTLHLDFDTGSSDLWVFNSQLDNDTTRGHNIYRPENSPTYSPFSSSEEEEEATWEIHYGDGSGAKGNVAYDTVSLGGDSSSSSSSVVSVPRQAIELATSVSSTFAHDSSNDGLLGLGFGNINRIRPQRQPTFFENLIPSLSEPVFTVHFPGSSSSSSGDDKSSGSGTYEFGRIDHSRYIGQEKEEEGERGEEAEDSLSWIPIDSSNGWWEFPSQRFSVSSSPSSSSSSQPEEGIISSSPNTTRAILDTGTTLIMADPHLASSYYSHVKGASEDTDQAAGWTFPCSSELPDLKIEMGSPEEGEGKWATIRGQDIRYAEMDDRGEICYGGIQKTPEGSPIAVFGTIFFKSNFVAFFDDSPGEEQGQGGKKVGFAPSA